MTIATAALVTRAIDILAAAGLRPFILAGKQDGPCSQTPRFQRAADDATAPRAGLAATALAVGIGLRKVS